MSLSNKFLSPEDLDNKLDVVGQSVLNFSNIFAKSGLQSDSPEEGLKDLKVEVEIDLSEIKNTSAEIEIELKLANTINASIEADKEALAREAINRDVVDYSIKSFNNQMLAEQRGDMIVETLESSGMQSAMGTVSDGLRFVIENKKAILEKALEKLKQLFAYLVKKIKEYYRKGFYAFHKLVNLPSRVTEILSGLPQGQLITPNMLSESTILEIEKGFGIFTLLNLGDSKKEYSFSFADDTDRLRMEQVFSGKMFLDMEFAAKDGVLKTRDVDLLGVMSNKDVIKKYFNYSIPSGFDFEDDVVFPIVANADDISSKNTIVSFGIAKTNFYTEDTLDLTQATTSTFKAIIKPDYLKNISITLSTLGDMIRVNAVLEGFNSGTLKSIEDTQNKGLNALEKKVNSLNVADKDMQAKFKTFKGIYDVLNIMSITNLMGLINTYARATRALEAIGKDVTAHLAAQNAEAGL